MNLSEDKIKSEIQRRFRSDLDLVDCCGINGLCKLFLYEHFIIRRLSWFFLVHDLCLSFARELDRQAIRQLKRWAGLYRGSEVGTLFRTRANLGLQLTSVEYHFEHLQLVKCCLLESSSDETVRGIFKIRQDRLNKFTSRWAAPAELAKLQPIVDNRSCIANTGVAL